MTKREITKKIVRLVVTTSVGTTVTSSALNMAGPGNSKLKAVQFLVGSYAVGAMVSEFSGSWSDKFVDSLFDLVEGSKLPTN